MRILVTGAGGQVGGAILRSHLPASALITAGRDQLDLAQPERIAAALDQIAPDLIVNPAAYTAVDRAEDETELAFRVNAKAPAAMADWAAGRNVPLIHFSTDYVFDGSGSRRWHEDDTASPLSVYGASKYEGEFAVRAAGGPHLIVRTSWVYAAQGTNFLRTIIRLAKERKELRIVSDQIGSPTSARLIADAVARIINPANLSLKDPFAAANGLVNVAASGETSWHGFAVSIVEGLKARGVKLTVENIVPIETRDYPTKATRPANSRLDLTRLRQLFGIQTPQWQQALDVELDLLVGELVS
jgi:dTDP-4-dehydrorhamnose reductase